MLSQLTYSVRQPYELGFTLFSGEEMEVSDAK